MQKESPLAASSAAPLLSVIIPVFNGEAYLKTLFDCLEAQTFSDFEVIFADDGSTDNTPALLKQLAANARFSAVTVVVPAGRKGVSAARNAGMDLARGQYIGFLDADDRVSPEYCALLREALELRKTAEQAPFELLLFQSVRVGEDGPFVPEDAAAEILPLSSEAVLERIAADPTKFGVYDMILNRQFAERNHFRFAEGYAYYEDYDFLFRTAAAAGSVLFTERKLYFYIQHSGSAVAQFRVERVSCVELMEQLIPYLNNTAPGFTGRFQNQVIPRIWWSVMWQACLAFSPADARAFAKMAHMRRRIRPLLSYPGRKVRYSSALFLCCPAAYYAAARILGRGRTEIGRTDPAPFRDYFEKRK